jgi:hypothetical protein
LGHINRVAKGEDEGIKKVRLIKTGCKQIKR